MTSDRDDRIELRGLRALGVHGVLPEEQSKAQPFEVDLDIETDLAAAGASDDLADTIDYGSVAGLVVSVITGERHSLLERLAERIAVVVLGDSRVRSVTVTVRKLRPPVAADVSTVGVRLTRRRTG